jgi:hypothetical protein
MSALYGETKSRTLAKLDVQNESSHDRWLTCGSSHCPHSVNDRAEAGNISFKNKKCTNHVGQSDCMLGRSSPRS